jgi:superfamily II DNA or RNA helicase
VDQISDTLNRFDVTHSFIASEYGYNPTAQVHVASVFTAARRLDHIPKPDLIIQDEAHHCTLNSTWGKILGHFKDVLRIGVTATPRRLSGEPLGDLFDSLIIATPMRQLIQQGVLSDYRMYAPTQVVIKDVKTRAGDYAKDQLAGFMDRPSITGDAVASYRQFASGRRAVAFCVSVAHATHTADAFRAAGFAAAEIDGECAKLDRRRIIQDFRDGRIQVLTSCDLISEGFDLPAIEVGIFLRPTQSLTIWLQQLGRCLRSMPGKQHAYLLDHASNAQRHGLPDEVREWSLDGKEQKKTKQESPCKMCRQCFAVWPLHVKVCGYCGWEFEVKPREVEQKEGELREMTQEELEAMRLRYRDRAQEQGQARSLEALKDIERRRGYKRGWAEIVWKQRQHKQSAFTTRTYLDGRYRPGQ